MKNPQKWSFKIKDGMGKKKGMVMWKNEGIAKKFSCFHALWVWLVIFVSSICCYGTMIVVFGGKRKVKKKESGLWWWERGEEEGVGEVKSDVERERKKNTKPPNRSLLNFMPDKFIPIEKKFIP